MYIPETNLMITQENDYVKLHEDFILKNIKTTEKPVFIIGSSHIQSLNATYIDSKIKSSCLNCSVYNLSVQADTIDQRSKVFDILLSAKPEMILYGISELDFAHIKNSEYDIPNQIFPTFQNMISEKINLFQYFEFLKIPSSPKDKTWNLIRQINKNQVSNDVHITFPYTPFVNALKSTTLNVSELELRLIASNTPSFNSMELPENNEAVKNLKKMIAISKQNDIPFVVFIVPFHCTFS